MRQPDSPYYCLVSGLCLSRWRHCRRQLVPRVRSATIDRSVPGHSFFFTGRRQEISQVAPRWLGDTIRHEQLHDDTIPEPQRRVVDTVGFLGLQGLFAAHVTGNFVTLAAAFVYGSHGTIGKILALPEFVGVVAVARVIGAALTARGKPTLTILLGVEAVFLAVFLSLGAAYGPSRTATSSRLSRPASPGHGHGASKCNAARALSGRTTDRDNDEQRHPSRSRRGRPATASCVARGSRPLSPPCAQHLLVRRRMRGSRDPLLHFAVLEPRGTRCNRYGHRDGAHARTTRSWRSVEICLTKTTVQLCNEIACRHWSGQRPRCSRRNGPEPAPIGHRMAAAPGQGAMIGQWLSSALYCGDEITSRSRLTHLGYGGDYFDGTLAILQPRPWAIGIGTEAGRLQVTHDIASRWT